MITFFFWLDLCLVPSKVWGNMNKKRKIFGSCWFGFQNISLGSFFGFLIIAENLISVVFASQFKPYFQFVGIDLDLIL